MQAAARAVKLTSATGLGMYGVSMITLHIDAPPADVGDGKYEVQRKKQIFPTWFHDIGRIPTIAAGTFLAKFFLHYVNTSSQKGVDILMKHMDERPPNTSLITVSNHTATVDDPAVLASYLPWSYCVPWRSRWSLCSQEYSYERGSLLSTIFYSARTLPIKRGAGIDHKMLKDLHEKVQQGEWVHIFPEGKIEQREALGGRPAGPERDRIGRLKWGVGKLIARAEQRPVVIPFYHVNMQKLMPQNEHNKLISVIPNRNHHVHIRVGDPISFDDLFEKYQHALIDRKDQTSWETKEHEKELYSAITKRIEEKLLDLEKEIRQDQQQGKLPQ